MIESILVDWGTTNARAYGLGLDGAVVDRREAALGIRNVADGDFAAAFDTLVGDWRNEDRQSAPPPVLMSGMIGSRQGWVETAYVPCPADLKLLAAGITLVPERPNVGIVPGVCLPGDAARHDVMRGEEVQCFGALALVARHDAVICLPGTHSKWVQITAGVLRHFATSMTGETYAVMRRHSILSALMPGESATDNASAPGVSFIRGVDRSGETGGLLNHLFSVRADGLFDAIPPDGLADYLSGILIGHEVRAMADMFKPDEPVLLVGGDSLAARYEAAFSHLKIQSMALDAEQATVTGLTRLQEFARRDH